MEKHWEFGDEYLRINSLMRKAVEDKDVATIKKLKPRFDELHGIMWNSLINGFPELKNYSSFVEALRDLCQKNNMPFPDLDDKANNFTGKGDWRETGRYVFGVGNKKRSVQIFPLESRGYINVEVYENQNCYKGQTTSVEESAIVLSLWYAQECSIEELHNKFQWMPSQSFKFDKPRMTFE